MPVGSKLIRIQSVLGLFVIIAGSSSVSAQDKPLLETWKQKLGASWNWASVNEEKSIFVVSPKSTNPVSSLVFNRLTKHEELNAKQFDVFVKTQSENYEADFKKETGVAAKVLQSSDDFKLLEAIDVQSGKPMLLYWKIVESNGQRWLLSARVPHDADDFQKKDISKFFLR